MENGLGQAGVVPDVIAEKDQALTKAQQLYWLPKLGTTSSVEEKRRFMGG
ncbi:hypothetical protein [Spirosoma pomorum]